MLIGHLLDLLAAETRLSNAMSLVRWLVERSLTHLNKKVINALFSHLTQTIITPEGTLIRNAMDYIKALKMIVSYAPHLEHLGQGSWECLMSICWDAALGQRIEYDKEEWSTADLEPESINEESESDPDQEYATPSLGTQKRKFTSTMTSTIDRARRSEQAGPRLTTETTELISIIPILLYVPNAPILPPPQLPEQDRESDQPFPRAGIRILRRTIKFLRIQSAETAAHRSILSALTIVLGELEVNAVQVMIESAPKILALLLPLWHTKLKDQVVLALRIILPFLSSSPFVCDAEPEENHIDRTVFTDLLALRDAIARSPPGKRSHILELPYLSLKITPSHIRGSAARPMHTPLICATQDFTDPMIMTWATLELMADSLALLHQHHEASSLRSATPASTGSNKRQRIEEPVVELLQVMTSARYVEHRLSALQTMYFFILSHWESVHDRLQVMIREALQHLMVDPVPEVQQWADIDLAAICHVALPAETPKIQVKASTTQPVGNEWLEIWHLALRKLIVTAGASSRSAALLLQVILKKQLLEPVLIITSIGKFLEAVNDQGPAAPYDSVCDFMVDCLDAADEDARLHRMGFTAKVSEWFRTAWLAQEKADAGDRANFEIGSAWRLICRLAGLGGGLNLIGDARPLTSSPLFLRMQKEEQVVDIRNFILHAKLPPPPSDQNLGGHPTEDTKETSRPYATSDARALSRLFGHKLQQLDLTDADASNVARLRNKLDGCVLILLVESGFIDADPEHSQANFETAGDLLEKTLQLAFQKNWTLAERAKLFVGLDAMFPQARLASRGGPEALLCVAGHASGILSVIKNSAGRKRQSVEEQVTMPVSTFHVKLWQKLKVSYVRCPASFR